MGKNLGFNPERTGCGCAPWYKQGWVQETITAPSQEFGKTVEEPLAHPTRECQRKAWLTGKCVAFGKCIHLQDTETLGKRNSNIALKTCLLGLWKRSSWTFSQGPKPPLTPADARFKIGLRSPTTICRAKESVGTCPRTDEVDPDPWVTHTRTCCSLMHS